MAKLVKFTRTREELNPEKKTKLGPDKMATEKFDVYVNADAVLSVDSGEFGKPNVAHDHATTIHLVSGVSITVDQEVGEVVSTLSAAAKS